MQQKSMPLVGSVKPFGWYIFFIFYTQACVFDFITVIIYKDQSTTMEV